MTKIICPKCKTEKELDPANFSADLKAFIAGHKGHGYYLASHFLPRTDSAADPNVPAEAPTVESSSAQTKL